MGCGLTVAVGLNADFSFVRKEGGLAADGGGDGVLSSCSGLSFLQLSCAFSSFSLSRASCVRNKEYISECVHEKL